MTRRPLSFKTRQHSLSVFLGSSRKQMVQTSRTPSNKESANGSRSPGAKWASMPRSEAMPTISWEASTLTRTPSAFAKRPEPTPSSSQRPFAVSTACRRQSNSSEKSGATLGIKPLIVFGGVSFKGAGLVLHIGNQFIFPPSSARRLIDNPCLRNPRRAHTSTP